ncbi:MAG: deoxyribose-phosphate aldolase [Bacteroidales bacterium]|nr:MAG: deoxyribose-phosphate aldolase [Bacteroidales bacterium]
MIDLIEERFSIEADEIAIEKNLLKIKEIAKSREKDAEVLKKCFSLIDLTTLNSTDGEERGRQFAKKLSGFNKQYPNLQNVAAICVYPSLVATVKENLITKNVKIASVAAGFPSSQTFIDIKLSECQMAIEFGADELDVVISLGAFLEGDYFTVFSELQQIKDVAEETRVKVILETGALPSLQEIKLASFLAMEAGADFIKTSTGKLEPAATPEAMYVMCEAIKEFNEKTGKKIGIKPAGGIAKTSDATLYYSIVEQILGNEWLNPELFRLGASRLANNLLSDITGKEVSYY